MVQPSILKSHKHSKMIETHNDWLQNRCWLSFKSMTPNFVVVVSVLLPIFGILAGVCHICAFLLKELSCYKVQLLINGC